MIMELWCVPTDPTPTALTSVLRCVCVCACVCMRAYVCVCISVQVWVSIWHTSDAKCNNLQGYQRKQSFLYEIFRFKHTQLRMHTEIMFFWNNLFFLTVCLSHVNPQCCRPVAFCLLPFFESYRPESPPLTCGTIRRVDKVKSPAMNHTFWESIDYKGL